MNCLENEPVFVPHQPTVSLKGTEGFNQLSVTGDRNVVVIAVQGGERRCAAPGAPLHLGRAPAEIYAGSRSFTARPSFELRLSWKVTAIEPTFDPLKLMPQPPPAEEFRLPKHDGTYLDHGEKAKADPVVQLVSATVAASTGGSGLICTGTRAVVGGEVGVLTAAHCMYQETGTGALGPRWKDLRVDHGPALNLLNARVTSSFSACARRGSTAQRCIEHDGAPDLAFIPAPISGETWAVCDAQPDDNQIVVLGYGYDGDVLPESLLLGHFAVQIPSEPEVWWVANGKQEEMVNKGDSGGPALMQLAWDQRKTSRPSICWTVSAYVDDGNSRTARLTPAWLAGTLDTTP
ncbi:MAG: hypothetical protein QM723_27340 [Myxococcaceae bacterium]